jgi:sugar lactone lactonase YvrE
MRISRTIGLSVIVLVLVGQTSYAAPGSIATFAGEGKGQLDSWDVQGYPTGISISDDGEIYFGDAVMGIRHISNSGIVTTVSTQYGAGLAWGGDGSLYVADGRSRVYRVDGSGSAKVFAGDGSTSQPIDGVPATASSLSQPQGLAVTSSGAVLIADANHHRVRSVDANGIITTVAGTGTAGFSGDGGPAISARLNTPDDLAVDAQGNLFIADTFNNRIRKVDKSGRITTVAGTGCWPAGDPNVCPIGDGASAILATLDTPYSIDLDSAGSVLIADSYHHRVRKVGADGNISTVAGNGVPTYAGDGGQATSANLYLPVGVQVDPQGGFYVTDYRNHRVRNVNSSGVITTVAGTGRYQQCCNDEGGWVKQSILNSPQGVTTDQSGNVYIADSYHHRIIRIRNGKVSTIAGSGTGGFAGDGGFAVDALLAQPSAVAVGPDGIIYISDAGNNRIRRVNPGGVINTFAGNGLASFSGDGGLATSASFNFVNGLSVDPSGNVYAADTLNHRIRKIDNSGIVTTIAGTGASGFSGDGVAMNATLTFPYGVTYFSGDLYVADSGNMRIRKVDRSGMMVTIAGNGLPASEGDGLPATSASLNFPTSVVFDASKDMFISELDGGRVRRIDGITNQIMTVVGGVSGGDDTGLGIATALSRPQSLAMNGLGFLFIAERDGNRLRAFEAF